MILMDITSSNMFIIGFGHYFLDTHLLSFYMHIPTMKKQYLIGNSLVVKETFIDNPANMTGQGDSEWRL